MSQGLYRLMTPQKSTWVTFVVNSSFSSVSRKKTLLVCSNFFYFVVSSFCVCDVFVVGCNKCFLSNMLYRYFVCRNPVKHCSITIITVFSVLLVLFTVAYYYAVAYARGSLNARAWTPHRLNWCYLDTESLTNSLVDFRLRWMELGDISQWKWTV